MFEKNISKILNLNINLFTYRIELEYDSLRRKNHHNIVFFARDDFKLESFDNMRIIENHFKRILKLHYFRKVIFTDIFSEFEENLDLKDIWVYRLKEIFKMKRIIRNGNDLIIFIY